MLGLGQEGQSWVLEYGRGERPDSGATVYTHLMEIVSYSVNLTPQAHTATVS